MTNKNVFKSKGKHTLVKNKLQGEHPKQILYNLTFKIVKVSTKADNVTTTTLRILRVLYYGWWMVDRWRGHYMISYSLRPAQVFKRGAQSRKGGPKGAARHKRDLKRL